MAPRHSALMLLCRDLGVTGAQVMKSIKCIADVRSGSGQPSTSPAPHLHPPGQKRADRESDFLEGTWPPRSVDGSAACRAGFI